MDNKMKGGKEQMTEEQKEFLIVTELPQVPTNVAQGEDGKQVELITFTDALKEILESVRIIKKGVVGA